jgi:hypothetical protein
MTCIPLLGPESKGILKRRRQMHKGTETQAAVRWKPFGHNSGHGSGRLVSRVAVAAKRRSIGHGRAPVGHRTRVAARAGGHYQDISAGETGGTHPVGGWRRSSRRWRTFGARAFGRRQPCVCGPSPWMEAFRRGTWPQAGSPPPAGTGGGPGREGVARCYLRR